MTTTARAHTADLKTMVFGAGPITVQHQQDSPQLKQRHTDRLYQIANALQTTLEVTQLIQLFGREISVTIPFDGLDYRNTQHNIQFSQGKKASHSCNYNLIINEQELGELTFTRRTKFLQFEILELESLLCGLVYPLRNALLYAQTLQLVHKDPLTGIDNRAAMNEALQREVEYSHRHHSSLSMIVMDIDYFKQINDTFGHTTGDNLLKDLVQCAAHCIRGCDMLFRYGGEEFVILLTNTDKTGALFLAERIRRKVEQHDFHCRGSTTKMTVSIGIANLELDKDGQWLFDKADQAMYQAKADGRNRVRA